MSKSIRILHGHVDKGLLQQRDAQIYSVRFQRDPMPTGNCRAVLLILPSAPGCESLVELVGNIALENEALKKQVHDLEQTCMQQASDIVTMMDNPEYDPDDTGDRRALAERDDFADPHNGGLDDEDLIQHAP